MTILAETESNILTLTINRPEVRNALNKVIIEQLIQELTKAAANKALKAILVTGAGDRAFCAGADLQELHEKTALNERTEFFTSIMKIVEAICRCPHPVIAKVKGAAVAGGMGLVAAADMVFASDDAYFSLPEIHLGLAPLIVMTPLTRALPQKVLMDMALTGRKMMASEAQSLGLVSRISQAGMLDEEVEKILSHLAQCNQPALHAIKKTCYDALDESYFATLQTRPGLIGQISVTPEAVNGIHRFLATKK